MAEEEPREGPDAEGRAGGGEPDDDEDARAILARRRAFVAAALAGLALASAEGCHETQPAVCLQPTMDPRARPGGPQPAVCLTPAAAPWDASAPPADTGAPAAYPQPCLEVAEPPPQPCLAPRLRRDAGAPQPCLVPPPPDAGAPQPCLRIAPPRPCLSAPRSVHEPNKHTGAQDDSGGANAEDPFASEDDDVG